MQSEYLQIIIGLRWEMHGKFMKIAYCLSRKKKTLHDFLKPQASSRLRSRSLCEKSGSNLRKRYLFIYVIKLPRSKSNFSRNPSPNPLPLINSCFSINRGWERAFKEK